MNTDYSNGNVPLPEIHALMVRLLDYDEACYHAVPPMGDHVIPLRRWVKDRIMPFPGGNGVLEDRFPAGGIMVVGNDYDVVHLYETAVTSGYGPSGHLIEKHLKKLCDSIDPNLAQQLWFTNFCPGIRVANDQYGISPGWRFEPYRKLCREFFLHSLTVQRPSLVIALGAHVPRYLSTISVDLAAWSKNGFNDRGVVEAKFENGFRCKVISLVHAALRHLNFASRRYGEQTGHGAELAILKEAVSYQFGKI